MIFLRETVSVWVLPSPKSRRAQTKIAPTPTWKSGVGTLTLLMCFAATMNEGCAV